MPSLCVFGCMDSSVPLFYLVISQLSILRSFLSFQDSFEREQEFVANRKALAFAKTIYGVVKVDMYCIFKYYYFFYKVVYDNKFLPSIPRPLQERDRFRGTRRKHKVCCQAVLYEALRASR